MSPMGVPILVRWYFYVESALGLFWYKDVLLRYRDFHYKDRPVRYLPAALPACPTQSLRWRHNGRDSVSNHQPLHRLFKRLFRRRSKKTSKLCVTGLCAGNSSGTGEFPAQMTSNAENVSIWWRHRVKNRSMILCTLKSSVHWTLLSVLAWCLMAQSVCELDFSLLASWCLSRPGSNPAGVGCCIRT